MVTDGGRYLKKTALRTQFTYSYFRCTINAEARYYGDA